MQAQSSVTEQLDGSRTAVPDTVAAPGSTALDAVKPSGATAVDFAALDVAAPATRTPWWRTALSIARSLAALALAITLTWWAVPHLGSTTWRELGRIVWSVPGRTMGLLCLVWAAGLLAYTNVLSAGLPGLNRRRALTLNLTGSAVANLLPMGGAAGVATNLRMVRRWGYSPARFTAYTIVTNIWDVLSKLLLPLFAITALWVTGAPISRGLRHIALPAGVAVTAVALAVVLWLCSDRFGRLVSRGIGRTAVLLTRVLPRRWRAGTVGVRDHVDHAREACRQVIAGQWAKLSFGTIVYLALQAVLLYGCLTAVHVQVGVAAVVAGLAVDRLSTLAFITPGGIGLGEAASLALLTALGCPPAETAAGLMLFRLFTYVIEIPVGGVWLGAWLLAARRSPAPVGATA